MVKKLIAILVLLCMSLPIDSMTFAAAPANFKVIGYVFSSADTNAVPHLLVLPQPVGMQSIILRIFPI